MAEGLLVIPPNDILRHPLPNRIYHIAKGLSKYFRIYLLSYKGHPLRSDRKLRDLDCEEIEIEHAFRTKNVGAYYLLNAPQILRSIAKALSERNISVVIHANILPSYIVSRMAKEAGIPTIYDFLDYFPESAAAYYSSRSLRFLSHSFVESIVKRSLRMSTKIVTVSYTFKKLIESLINRRENNIEIIPNGIDHRLFRPMPTDVARKKTGLSDYERIILYYGSLDVWIDFSTLLGSVKGRDDLVLVLIGASHNSDAMKKLKYLIKKLGLEEKVIMIPPQPYERIPLFINSADLVLAPYKRVIKNYVTPLKIAETLACGKPVITQNIGEFKLWFSEKNVFYYNNFAEVKGIINNILDNYEAVTQDAEVIADRVRKKFSWDNLVKKYLRVMEGLL